MRSVTHKRRNYYNSYGEPPAKKSAPSIRLGAGFKWNLQALSLAADAVQRGGKSPVSALNELGVRVKYDVKKQSGPAHCPSFNVTVTVADMTFDGAGHSKREARAAAARACLAALLTRAGRVMTVTGEDYAADHDVSDFQCIDENMKKVETKVASPPPPPPVASNPAPKQPVESPGTALFGAPAVQNTHKSPINQLYENYPGLMFYCTFGDGTPLDVAAPPMQLSYSMRFKVVCQVKDQKFEGYGSSKKLAKLAAARAALATLQEGIEPSLPNVARCSNTLPQTVADNVAKLVNEKFNELMKEDLVHSKRKVLAGIVITINNKPDQAKVIGVTTGTKCVSGEHMSVSGRAINDSHAEVAARRCLQRHLYGQLALYAHTDDPTKPLPDSDLEPCASGGYRLKTDRQIHLYVSTAPCGDGRIFSPHESYGDVVDRHPNRLARGQLRTKIESGEGTIPVKNSANIVQTWDGVMQGERLLTMSCSDKVARWSSAGLQGALLSLMIKPVYLYSIVLGSLLHPDHMYRAICGRIEDHLTGLPPPFQLHRPLLARAASLEARSPARAPSFSVCWCRNDAQPEIINATTGKLENGQPSLLCKQSMYARWQYLIKRLPLLPQATEFGTKLPMIPENLDYLPYNEAKQLCPGYLTAKQRLIEAFDKAKLGRWVKKPLEQDHFLCEIKNKDPKVLFAWINQVTRYDAQQINMPNDLLNKSIINDVSNFDSVMIKAFFKNSKIIKKDSKSSKKVIDSKINKKDIKKLKKKANKENFNIDIVYSNVNAIIIDKTITDKKEIVNKFVVQDYDIKPVDAMRQPKNVFPKNRDEIQKYLAEFKGPHTIQPIINSRTFLNNNNVSITRKPITALRKPKLQLNAFDFSKVLKKIPVNFNSYSDVSKTSISIDFEQDSYDFDDTSSVIDVNDSIYDGDITISQVNDDEVKPIASLRKPKVFSLDNSINEHYLTVHNLEVQSNANEEEKVLNPTVRLRKLKMLNDNKNSITDITKVLRKFGSFLHVNKIKSPGVPKINNDDEIIPFESFRSPKVLSTPSNIIKKESIDVESPSNNSKIDNSLIVQNNLDYKSYFNEVDSDRNPKGIKPIPRLRKLKMLSDIKDTNIYNTKVNEIIKSPQNLKLHDGQINKGNDEHESEISHDCIDNAFSVKDYHYVIDHEKISIVENGEKPLESLRKPKELDGNKKDIVSNDNQNIKVTINNKTFLRKGRLTINVKGITKEMAKLNI